MSNKAIFGTRIPKDYFVTTGVGETDLGGGVDPWETGSYDMALTDAEIENYNIIQYTSVMPVESKKHAIDDVRHLMHHGAVLETIMANINGVHGDHICAGVVTAHVKRKKDNHHIGGFACEYEGHATKEKAKEILHQSMMGLVERRYGKDEVEVFDVDYTICDLVVTKKFGTVLAALCFVSYIFPSVDAI